MCVCASEYKCVRCVHLRVPPYTHVLSMCCALHVCIHVYMHLCCVHMHTGLQGSQPFQGRHRPGAGSGRAAGANLSGPRAWAGAGTGTVHALCLPSLRTETSEEPLGTLPLPPLSWMGAGQPALLASHGQPGCQPSYLMATQLHSKTPALGLASLRETAALGMCGAHGM